MKTAKAYTVKKISPAEIFGSKSLVGAAEVAHLKKKVCIKFSKTDFFSYEGVAFYAIHFEDITVLRHIKDLSDFSMKSKCTWKFGFVNKTTGEISLLFGGHSVADKNSVRELFKIAADVVKYKFQDDKLITFSMQNKSQHI